MPRAQQTCAACRKPCRGVRCMACAIAAGTRAPRLKQLRTPRTATVTRVVIQYPTRSWWAQPTREQFQQAAKDESARLQRGAGVSYTPASAFND